MLSSYSNPCQFLRHPFTERSRLECSFLDSLECSVDRYFEPEYHLLLDVYYIEDGVSHSGMSYLSFEIDARGRIDDVQKCVGLRNNVQELRAETPTCEGSLDESREVDHLDGYEPPAVYACRIPGFVLDIQLPGGRKGFALGPFRRKLLCGEGVRRHFGGA